MFENSPKIQLSSNQIEASNAPCSTKHVANSADRSTVALTIRANIN